MDMRSGGTTSNTDRIMGTLQGVDTRDTGSDMRQRYPSGIPSTYSASRTLLGRDGQDSEEVMENRPRPVVRGNHADPTIRRASDHEDSRRLASGLPTDLSGTLGTEAQESYLGADRSVPGRQTDPGDRRTSDRRSSTPGSDVASPSTGRPMWVSPTLDTPGNASRTLMTGLRRPGQRGVTAYRNEGEMTHPTAHPDGWLWAKLLQEEYPSEGYFMNTKGSGTGSWFRPRIALRDIPN